jgi:hypothetical protein
MRYVTEAVSDSREGGWGQMGSLLDDEVLETFAVVGTPQEVGPELVRRYGDLLDRATLYTPYAVDAELLTSLASACRSR